jgi:hypothetical protein
MGQVALAISPTPPTTRPCLASRCHQPPPPLAELMKAPCIAYPPPGAAARSSIIARRKNDDVSEAKKVARPLPAGLW